MPEPSALISVRMAQKNGAKEWRKRMAQTPLERRCMAA